MSARGRDGGGEVPEPMAGEDLVSLLYGELEPDEAARMSARVATDPTMSARLGEMRRVRELFSAMDEEEPPNRLTAQLLAEAARAAPQPRRAAAPAEAGLWARFVSWLQPLTQRPALAAAASLVLVAGVAGVLYMKKGDELTSTTSVTARSEPPPASSPMDTATGSAAADPAAPAPVIAAQGAQDSSGTAPGADGDGAERADESAKREMESPPAKPVAKRKRAASSTSSGKNMAYDKAPAGSSVKSGTVYGLSEQEMVPREQAQAAGEGGGGPTGGASMNKKSDDAPAPQAAPEPAPPATPPPADSKAPGKVNVRDLHRRAVDAAMDRRCAEVKMLAGQVRANDADYYAKSFAGDKRLQSCLASPSKSPARK